MREILALCVELDSLAASTYQRVADTCGDEDIATVFGHLAKEERTHVEWWSSLLAAWEDGLVPDIADEHDLLGRLIDIHAELTAEMPPELDCSTTDDMLDLAARLEFFMLDPLFGELLDLVQPGNRHGIQESYAGHIFRLVDLIERRYTRRGMASFLSGVLKRTHRNQQQLSSLASHDQLTGLHNRRGLLGHINQWLSWSQRYGRPIGVLLMDIDNFKQINDTFGHAAGDEALMAVATAISETVRTSDVVGRFGGDEFVVLVPESDEAELMALAHRIVEAISSRRFDVEGRMVQLTVSIGASWAPGGITVERDLLIAQADRSMYEAKAAGRNRTGSVLSTLST